MVDYCINDVNLTEKVYRDLVQNLKKFGFSEQSIELEHDVARIIGEQERNGFELDIPKAVFLLGDLKAKADTIHQRMVEAIPPKIIELKTKVKSIQFNPGSRQQIGNYLVSIGWKPEKFTPTGQPVVDEKTLKNFDHPVARQFEEYLMLQKRIAQLDSWLEAADKNHLVHGKVITNGAITGRMTHHSPNMAQVPSKGSPYGEECRECWKASKGILVGIDASGLELRMLAHYMRDEAYAKAVVSGRQEDGTDIHSINQQAAGLETRDQAKTFIYALIYGAGPAKLGSIVGGSYTEGTELTARFLSKTPNLQKLRKRVANLATKGYLPGLDGRILWIRSPHSAFNTLLQGAGAVVMKKALVLFEQSLRDNGYWFKFRANVHDEWQTECLFENAEHVGQLGVNAIEEAGRQLSLRVPLTGEYKIGRNWKETH